MSTSTYYLGIIKGHLITTGAPKAIKDACDKLLVKIDPAAAFSLDGPAREETCVPPAIMTFTRDPEPEPPVSDDPPEPERAESPALAASEQPVRKGRTTLTPDQVAEAARRYRAGESMASLATESGASEAQLRQKLTKAGVEMRPHGGARVITPQREERRAATMRANREANREQRHGQPVAARHDEYAGKRDAGQGLEDGDWPDIQNMLKKGDSPIHVRKIAADYDVPFDVMRGFIDGKLLDRG